MLINSSSFFGQRLKCGKFPLACVDDHDEDRLDYLLTEHEPKTGQVDG